jgi:hypothetical protein
MSYEFESGMVAQTSSPPHRPAGKEPLANASARKS